MATHRGQFSLLVELFEPKQPFYLRYCSSLTPALETAPLRGLTPSSKGMHKPPLLDLRHMTFVNDLDVGCAFDYCHEGVWEVAIIEKLSELRDKFEICLPESKLVLSLKLCLIRSSVYYNPSLLNMAMIADK